MSRVVTGQRSDTSTLTRSATFRMWPDRRALLDSLAVVLLGLLALSGLGQTYSGWEYLAVGGAGLVLGVLLARVTRSLHWPFAAPALLAALLFFLLGPALTLRSLGDTALVPVPVNLETLASQVVHGWKDLLTTLPPVDGAGVLLVLPWVLGLATGVLAQWAASARPRQEVLRVVAPGAVLLVLLAVVVLLGVDRPSSLLLQGFAFGALLLGWWALRADRVTEQTRAAGPVRLVAGAALLAVALGVAVPVSGALEPDDRTVLRDHVEPPFDIGRYASPLASFRRYVDPKGTSASKNLFDSELFSVSGLPAGTPVRIAAMDAYDGMVWGATNDALPGAEAGTDSFQRVSSVIHNPGKGEVVTGRVTVGRGWSGVWLPAAGALQGMEFLSGDPRGKAEAFRYNLATRTAVVPTGVHPGDTYRFTARLPEQEVTPDTVLSSSTPPMVEGTAFLDGPAGAWSGDAETPVERVLAIAEHLRTTGRYSDGVVRSERMYAPGHGLGRLSTGMVDAPTMVGNDEQYAALMALLATKVGVPARVVLGAELPESGVVTGGDVHAWVELRAADGEWVTLPRKAFVPTEPPDEEQRLVEQPMSGTVVVPPAPIQPPSFAGEQADQDLKKRRAERQDDEDEESLVDRLPAWVRIVLLVVGGPLLLLALLLGAVVGLKAWRRSRRRHAPVVSARFVGAWHDLVEHARDLGRAVPTRAELTRREQAAAIPGGAALALARSADRHVFGPQTPKASTAREYWGEVAEERRRLSSEVGRWRRFLAAVDPRTLLPARRDRKRSRRAGRGGRGGVLRRGPFRRRG